MDLYLLISVSVMDLVNPSWYRSHVFVAEVSQTRRSSYLYTHKVEDMGPFYMVLNIRNPWKCFLLEICEFEPADF